MQNEFFDFVMFGIEEQILKNIIYILYIYYMNTGQLIVTY